jgi:hypothetical protein
MPPSQADGVAFFDQVHHLQKPIDGGQRRLAGNRRHQRSAGVVSFSAP